MEAKTIKQLIRNQTRQTLSFYKYFTVENPLEMRNQWQNDLGELEVLGRIYIAKEGINAQCSVPIARLEEFFDYIRAIPQLKSLRFNKAIEEKDQSFSKLSIKQRAKIVADGIDDPNFDPSKTGIHLKAEEFNALAENKDTIIVDMRNHYEHEVGHFKNALLPDSDRFKDEIRLVESMLENKQENHIMMYCTGGIRCEKAAAYLKFKGFKNVYQLEGGIIEYVRRIKELNLENKFMGKNFVFDERLGERITDEIIASCHQCGAVADSHTNCANLACHILFIQCEQCKKNYHNCCSAECMTVIKLPVDVQENMRKGKSNNSPDFRKARLREKILATHSEKR